MASARDLALRLVISARDQASGVLGALTGRVAQLGAAIAAWLSVRAVADFFAAATRGANDFDAAMRELAYAAKAPPEDLARLRAEAERIAQSDLPYTAEEAAAGMTALAKAGQSTTQVLASLPAVLALAQGGQLEVAAAAELTTRALSTFALGADQAARVADTLVAAADASETGVSALAEALSYAAPQAAAAGYSIEETVAALALLAKGGLEGSRAGTALGGVLAQLADPASTASRALAQMGITTRALGPVLAALSDGSLRADAAIAAFGQEAGPGLRTLIAQGQAGLAGFVAELQGAEGASQRAAAALTTPWDRAWKGLSSLLGTISRRVGEGLLTPVAAEVDRVSAALGAWIASGQLERIRDALGTGFAAAAASAEEALGRLDLGEMVQRLGEAIGQADVLLSGWAARVQAVGEGVGRAVDGMSAAWLLFRSGVEGAGVVVSAAADLVMRGVVALREWGVALGLASQESLDRVRSMQEGFEQAAAGYAESVRQHMGEAGEAWDRATGPAEAATAGLTQAQTQQTAAADGLAEQAKLTAAELGALATAHANTALASERAAAAQRTEAAAQSQQTAAAEERTASESALARAYAQAGLSADLAGRRVEEMGRRTGAASTQAAAAKRTEAQASAELKRRLAEEAETRRQGIAAAQAELESAGRAVGLAAQEGDVRLARLRHLQEEAIARGDTARAAQLATDLGEREVRVLRATAEARRDEAAAAAEVARQIEAQVRLSGDTSRESTSAVAEAQAIAQAKQWEAAAAEEAWRHESAMLEVQTASRDMLAEIAAARAQGLAGAQALLKIALAEQEAAQGTREAVDAAYRVRLARQAVDEEQQASSRRGSGGSGGATSGYGYGAGYGGASGGSAGVRVVPQLDEAALRSAAGRLGPLKVRVTPEWDSADEIGRAAAARGGRG
jgi:TP901 family phage tail tape measure protein